MENKTLKLYGAPWYITLIACAVVIMAAALGALGKDMPSTLALMLAIGVPFYELGKRIPIWNTYIGGGILLAFIATALLNFWHVIPAEYAENIDEFTSKTNFLNMFIVLLITGSILSLDRKTLLRSFAGYIPAILGGVLAAILFGILGGLLFGVNPARIITHYVLPIMGGGNGGGAIPLSQVYERVTGDAKENYYNFAVIILTIANIYAIITAALLNSLGKVKKDWTGDRFTLLRNQEGMTIVTEEKKQEVPTIAELGAGLLLALSCYAFGRIMGEVVLPGFTMGGLEIPIHSLAYMIILVVILAATGVVPERVRLATKRLQSFFSTAMTLVIMVGVGIDLDIPELLASLTSMGNILIPLFVVIGAIVGSALVGWLVGFYPIDSAVTSGLCMANRGGSGDLAVLGSAERMGLMAYAQLSSRLGGAIILVLGGLLFGVLL